MVIHSCQVAHPAFGGFFNPFVNRTTVAAAPPPHLTANSLIDLNNPMAQQVQYGWDEFGDNVTSIFLIWHIFKASKLTFTLS